ncbi:MAG: TrkH family potassium uptake protein [Spirochaetota bacterium]|nr:TrkH family potassium uptake protein [Spirochaetota bacterium]
MNFGIVLYIQSFLVITIGLFQIFPLIFAIYYYKIEYNVAINSLNTINSFIYSIIITIAMGIIINLAMKKYRKTEVKIRESFAVVTFGWVFAAFFASLPFLIHAYFLNYPSTGSINTFTDAYFEMMSGFTTTGSTILTDIEVLPKGLLFWRSLSHWLGGMGIILLTVAILPALGVGGMQLYQAEVPGPITDKIAPRISQTAKILWGVYLLFTVIETILLMLGGMDFFDSLCHTFGTIATGGFSTKNLSVGHYNSTYINLVITVFMFLAGTSFTLHYRFLKGNLSAYTKDSEFKFYFSVILLSTIIIMLDTYQKSNEYSVIKSVESVLFQVVSIITTTGYGIGLDSATNANSAQNISIFQFGIWSTFSQSIMILLMILGGSAGSTGGGVKNIRVLLAIKFMFNEIIKFIYPRHVKLIRVGQNVIKQSILLSTLGFLIIHIIITMLATVVMNFLENDFIISFTSVIATLNNIGPGLGKIGPTGNFSEISSVGKWVLSFCMLLGRLELYSVIIIFFPIAWKKN